MNASIRCFEVESIWRDYHTIVAWVLGIGQPVNPRGLATREVLDVTLIVHDITKSLPVGCGRGLRTAIGAIEALQLIGGFSNPELTCRIAPNMKSFRETNGQFHGAYGPRLYSQLYEIQQLLTKDPNTRQAVATIWSPGVDLRPLPPSDLPCTVMLQFLVRDGKLIMHTTMRSNDVWWGLAYDVFQFTMLQQTLARCLGLTCGPYHHHAVSLHIYEKDIETALKLGPPRVDAPALMGLDMDYRDTMIDAARCAYEITQPGFKSFSYTENWLRKEIEPFLIDPEVSSGR